MFDMHDLLFQGGLLRDEANRIKMLGTRYVEVCMAFQIQNIVHSTAKMILNT